MIVTEDDKLSYSAPFTTNERAMKWGKKELYKFIKDYVDFPEDLNVEESYNSIEAYGNNEFTNFIFDVKPCNLDQGSENEEN